MDFTGRISAISGVTDSVRRYDPDAIGSWQYMSKIGESSMTDAIHFLGAPESGAVATVTGFLVEESDHDIRVRVADGTWTFERQDVLAIRDSGRTETQAVVVDIRAGATADFTRRLRIDITDRPMTLAAPPSQTFGDARLHRLAEVWATGLDIDAAQPAAFTRAHTRARQGTRHDIHCDSLD